MKPCLASSKSRLSASGRIFLCCACASIVNLEGIFPFGLKCPCSGVVLAGVVSVLALGGSAAKAAAAKALMSAAAMRLSVYNVFMGVVIEVC